MLKNVLKNQKGNLLMEVLVVLVVVGILLTSSSAFPYTLTRTSVDLANRQVAQTYASEAVSALRGIQYDNWNSFPNPPYSSSYRIVKDSSGWSLSNGDETIGNYRREVIVSDVLRDGNGNISGTGTVDPNTKKAEVTVFWNSGAGELSTKLITLVSNWKEGYDWEIEEPGLEPWLYWAMDENSGNETIESINNLQGTVSGASWTEGFSGSALQFNGINSYVTTPYNPAYDITNEITVMSWVRWDIEPSTGQQWAQIVNKNIDNEWQLQHNSNNSQFEFALRTVNSRQYVMSNTSPQIGVWYHVTGVYNGENIRIFVNGVNDTVSARNHTGDILVSNSAINIGSRTSLDRFFGGTIDEVRVYNFALTDSEILDVYLSYQ